MLHATPLSMFFFLFARGFSLLLDLIWVAQRGDRDKELEILLLRQQLRILQRKQPCAPRISRWEKLTLVVLAGKLTRLTAGTRTRLGEVVLLFKPDTLLQWHRDLVRRKWTFTRYASVGRPPTSPDLEALILRLAKENPNWGYGKLEGELGAPRAKLGYDIGRSTIRDVLKRNRIPSAPDRVLRAGGETVAELATMAMELSQLAPAPALPMGVEIRPANDDDTVREYARLYAQLFEVPTGSWVNNLAEAEVEIFHAGHDTFHRYLADEGGRAMAAGMTCLEGGVASLETLSTVPKCRNRGIGAVLATQSLQHEVENGADIAVVGSSPGARWLYGRMGFRYVCTANVLVL